MTHQNQVLLINSEVSKTFHTAFYGVLCGCIHMYNKRSVLTTVTIKTCYFIHISCTDALLYTNVLYTRVTLYECAVHATMTDVCWCFSAYRYRCHFDW